MSITPGDYVHFKARVPLRRVSVGAKQWRYYDYGPKQVPPLICLSGVAGTADVFYKQIMFLATRGYRVIAADAPPTWSHQEWLISFEKFLDSIDIHHVHLYGTELGGFLAQLFAQYRPRRVKSLVLSNTFLDTQYFAENTPWSTLINWTPSFMLKRYILTGLPTQPQDPFIADAVDFVVTQLETLEREELASRLILKTKPASVGRLLLADSAVTIMDTNDLCTVPQHLKNLLGERYPSAREAFLKTGGDFPFLSRPDEINLHLQLHLRRVGVEGQNELFKDPSQRDNSGNPAERSEPSEDSSDTSEHNRSSFAQVDSSPSNQNVDSSDIVDEAPRNCSADFVLVSLLLINVTILNFSGARWIIFYVFPGMFNSTFSHISQYALPAPCG
eukprot:TRINITY_DN28300_c0_g1_i1.p1 TRINITY_DN28300_c0_g1~~TRINITY_DN28300_c0_g1_i1.p1  ORF type:complete len:388 (-),score=55.37 TRINITY_DN28300_c0_g1_i1:153-1316(-)